MNIKAQLQYLSLVLPASSDLKKEICFWLRFSSEHRKDVKLIHTCTSLESKLIDWTLANSIVVDITMSTISYTACTQNDSYMLPRMNLKQETTSKSLKVLQYAYAEFFDREAHLENEMIGQNHNMVKINL